MTSHSPESGRNMKAQHWLIAGRVQGVGFRAFALRQARELAVRGWARNLQDGRVEVLALGSLEILGEFRLRLARGPASALVEALVVKEIAEALTFEGFSLLEDGEKPWGES